MAAASGVPDSRVDELLELTGIPAFARRRAGAYSMGMRQRLALAAALLGDPRVLILDEPANGLDPEGIRWLRGFLSRLSREEGKTILVSSHLLQEVAQTVDDVVIIANGALVRQGAMADSAARRPPWSVPPIRPRWRRPCAHVGIGSGAEPTGPWSSRPTDLRLGRRRGSRRRPARLGAAAATGRPRGAVPVPHPRARTATRWRDARLVRPSGPRRAAQVPHHPPVVGDGPRHLPRRGRLRAAVRDPAHLRRRGHAVGPRGFLPATRCRWPTASTRAGSASAIC